MAVARALACGLGAWAALALTAPSVLAAELIMVERAGCGWCQRWDREIAPIYGKTDAGVRAPLRRIDAAGPWPDGLEAVTAERFTPTFILVDGGREVGRLRGYPGESFFWALLDEMFEELP